MVLGRNAVRHIDFKTLVLINREVVSLTGEKHEYAEEDETRIKSFLKEIKELIIDDPNAEILEKASLLTFRIASGQHFHEGNKRTALVAVLAFLRMNRYTLDIRDLGLVTVVDRAGISTANLNDIRTTLKTLIRVVSERERKLWEETAKKIVESNREFLIFIGSERRA